MLNPCFEDTVELDHLATKRHQIHSNMCHERAICHKQGRPLCSEIIFQTYADLIWYTLAIMFELKIFRMTRVKILKKALA